ncbi:MAG: type 1 glutamine amidotransferase [Proteobacteria bacterium]|nr:type 1 glutamine amidotransferase [Pseudomonadota bacterium]
MRTPVLIIQHEDNVGPGIITSILEERSIPWKLIQNDSKGTLPKTILPYSGLISLGGSMSVNDNLPFLAREISLIEDAIYWQRPVIGHCLGGQLLACALGATVTNNPVWEIGWSEIRAKNNSLAHLWLRNIQTVQVFQWHYQTFSIPEGATPILWGEYCQNQAFVHGLNLAMQFHVEINEEMILQWIHETLKWPNLGASVQSADIILNQIKHYLPLQTMLAQNLYEQWLTGFN